MVGFDPALVALPNSGMTLRFSYRAQSDWTANEEAYTGPDVLVEMTPEDWVAYVNARQQGLTDPNAVWDRVLRECVGCWGRERRTIEDPQETGLTPSDAVIGLWDFSRPAAATSSATSTWRRLRRTSEGQPAASPSPAEPIPPSQCRTPPRALPESG